MYSPPAFAIQMDVAERVAQSLAVELRASNHSPVTRAAYEAYLKGLFSWNKRTGEDLGKALACFQAMRRLTWVSRTCSYLTTLRCEPAFDELGSHRWFSGIGPLHWAAREQQNAAYTVDRRKTKRAYPVSHGSGSALWPGMKGGTNLQEAAVQKARRFVQSPYRLFSSHNCCAVEKVNCVVTEARCSVTRVTCLVVVIVF